MLDLSIASAVIEPADDSGDMYSRVPIVWEVWGDRVLQYVKQMETRGEEADEVCELQHTMLHKKKP